MRYEAFRRRLVEAVLSTPGETPGEVRRAALERATAPGSLGPYQVLGGWEIAYRAWSNEYPYWAPFGERWLGRTGGTRCRLAEMREILENPPILESVDESR